MKCAAVTRPVVRYHGGKWNLAPWIVSFFPPHRIYVEPFGGAASVLLQKPRSYAEVYNDLESEIVNLFQVLRDRKKAKELKRQLSLTAFAREEWEQCYARATTQLERARCMIVRAYMGFGSASTNPKHATGFRASAYRSGTTPAHDWANFPACIDAIVERLQGVCIEKRPATDVIKSHDSLETLFFVDPPYVRSVREQRQRSVYKFELSDRQHRALAAVLREVEGMVLLSGYRCSLYDDELFPDWNWAERECLADGARARTEVLWLNPAAEERLTQLRLFTNPGGGKSLLPLLRAS